MKRIGRSLNSVIFWTLAMILLGCEPDLPGVQFKKFQGDFLEYAQLDSQYASEDKIRRDWYTSIIKAYDSYEFDDSIVSNLNLDSVRFEIICGTWCSDTRNQVPRFTKILDSLNVSPKKVNYHFVDRDKIALDSTFASEYEFKKVPVFVVFRNDVEIGSIIETPEKTLELDLKSILEDGN